MVRVHGELWRAVAPQAIPAGAHVRVVRVTGLTVHVAPAGEVAPSRRVYGRSFRSWQSS